jgi:hypothetical protein
MNQGTKLVLLMKKNRSQKSRASVPLIVTSSDSRLCTQLAMSILPSGLNFEIYLSNIREIVTYQWPKNNVDADQ